MKQVGKGQAGLEQASLAQPKHRVTAAQFFLGMFVSQGAAALGLNTQYAGGEHLLDNVASALLALGLGFILAIPVWLLQKGNQGAVALDRPGKAAALGYLLYFVWEAAAGLALFQIFLLDTVNPDFSAGFVAAALLGAGLYGALRGVETIARCGVCVFAVLVLGCGLVFGMVALRFRPENLEPLFYQGFGQMGQGVALFLSRTTAFAEMALLLPQVRGNRARGFAGWSLGSGAFTCLVLVLMVGCLGPYAATQNFPVYTLAATTQVRSLQRLDTVFVGVWIAGLAIRLAWGLYACRLCAGAVFSKGRAKGWTAAAACFVLVLAQLAVAFPPVQRVVLSTRLLLWATLGAGCLVPLLLLLVRRGKRAAG